MSSIVTKRFASGASKLLRTPLYDCHVELGGKMVDYAGFEMPVLYKGQTHVESHNWVRSKVGLFDVSHASAQIQRSPASGLVAKNHPHRFGIFAHKLFVVDGIVK